MSAYSVKKLSFLSLQYFIFLGTHCTYVRAGCFLVWGWISFKTTQSRMRFFSGQLMFLVVHYAKCYSAGYISKIKKWSHGWPQWGLIHVLILQTHIVFKIFVKICSLSTVKYWLVAKVCVLLRLTMCWYVEGHNQSERKGAMNAQWRG